MLAPSDSVGSKHVSTDCVMGVPPIAQSVETCLLRTLFEVSGGDEGGGLFQGAHALDSCATRAAAGQNQKLARGVRVPKIGLYASIRVFRAR